MNVETDSYSSIIIEPEAYIEESYDILEEGLIEFLNSPKRHFDPSYTDYYEALLYKINAAKASIEVEDYYKLERIEAEVRQVIAKALIVYFEEFVDSEMLENITSSSAYFLYNIFFHEKRKKVVNCIASHAVNNRESLLKQFKANKKDVGYEHLLQEFADFKNKENISIIMSYSDIFKQIAFDMNGNLNEVVFMNLELSFSQLDFLTRLFFDSLSSEPYVRFFKDLLTHPDLSYIMGEFRSELIDKLKDLD